jgi:hypothetical protein
MLDVDLAREVAEKFRISPGRREEIIVTVSNAVSHWRTVAEGLNISKREIGDMAEAFLLAAIP